MPDGQSLQCAYVLHARRYRDSSLLLETFTRESGRLPCIARGALRARRADTRLQPFQPLQIQARGKGEVLTLIHAESHGLPIVLTGRRLFCGMYINELMQLMTARQDPVPALFDDYALSIGQLSAPPGSVEPILRRFEIRLLCHLGLGLLLDRDIAGDRIDPQRRYAYDICDGPRLTGDHVAEAISGKTLLALQSGEFGDNDRLREARVLMRRVLNHHLDGRPLKSRELFV
jgi:DNA repair protein RecO (recombination protein O)